MKLIKNDVDLTGMDCHMHSPFSPDAAKAGALPPEKIAEIVREKGLRGFIITDHVDIGHWDGKIIDFDKYFSDWDKIRRNNADLEIYIGLEVGFEEKYEQETYRIIKDLPVEYVINSVHYWGNPVYSEEWALGAQKAYTHYLECVCRSLDAPYDFSTVGHLGFSEKFSPYSLEERAMRYELFKPLMDEIIAKALSRGVRFELNTSTPCQLVMPRPEFLRAYKAAGGARPMLGSDAHISADIARNFDGGKRLLDEIWC